MQKLMIEAAINELAGKDQNPNVPYLPDEIARDAIACAKAGAAIVHFHARDADGAQRWTSAETYVEAIRLIKQESDVILYPTYPGRRSKEERIGHVLALAEHPDVQLELATLDVGATNTGTLNASGDGFARSGTYVNTNEDLLYFMKELRKANVTYNFGVRDVGHMRQVAAYARLGYVKGPLILKLFIADLDTHGPNPDARGLQMYLDMVPPGLTCQWFALVFGSNPEDNVFRRITMLAAAMGGHIRTGLGDNPRLDGTQYTNVDHVKIAVEMAHLAGRAVATPAEARQMMGMAT